MGVDYQSNYGIGFKINLLDSNDENNDKNFTIEKLEESLDVARFKYFQVGSDCYGGAENRVFVCSRDPFENGIPDLESIKSEIENHLTLIGIETDGDFGLVGGLRIW